MNEGKQAHLMLTTVECDHVFCGPWVHASLDPPPPKMQMVF